MDQSPTERLQNLADRAEIYDCMQRYARGIDRQDRDLLRSAHHDGASIDCSARAGGRVAVGEYRLAIPRRPARPGG